MIGDLQSLLIYCLTGALCVFAASKADKKPKLSFWFIVIILTLLAGFRHSSVGIDTIHYVELTESLRDGFKTRLNNIDEPLFILLSYVIVNLTDGYTLLLLVCSFITNFFVVKRLFELKSEISFPWAIFIYLCQYYIMTFNTIRQWIAIGIIFYFSKHLGEGKKGGLYFIVATLIASLFHKTALLGIVLLPLYYLIKKSKKSVDTLWKLLLIIASPFALAVLYLYVNAHYGGTYGNVSLGEVSYINVLRLAFVLFLMFMGAIQSRNWLIIHEEGTSLEKIRESDDVLLFNNVVWLAGICCSLMVLFFNYADRLAQYFIVFEMITIPYYIKKSRIKQIVIIFALVLFLYLRFMSFKANGYGEMPYIPFWSEPIQIQ